MIMLRLEVFSQEEQPNYEEYFECESTLDSFDYSPVLTKLQGLQNMIRVMDVTEESLRM